MTMSYFYDWLKNNDTNNIFCPPMSDTEVVDMLQHYLCSDYISVNPVRRHQYNTEWVYHVLMKYSKKFRKEFKAERRKYNAK